MPGRKTKPGGCKAQVPDAIGFATKPEIACDLIGKALDAGVPCAFVLADAVYGSDSRLRRMLEGRGQPYVLAVRSNHCLRFIGEDGFVQTDPATLADALEAKAWSSHAAGEGSKGLRLYDWARISLPWTCDPGFERFLLIRRSRRAPAERAYYFCFVPAGAALAELAAVAGLRWTIEECFQRAKTDLGLDHCEARSWHGWHRHMSLVMAAAAFLAKLAADMRRAAFWQTEQNESARNNRRLTIMAALVPSVPEIRYLLARILLKPPLGQAFIIAWSLCAERTSSALLTPIIKDGKKPATVVLDQPAPMAEARASPMFANRSKRRWERVEPSLSGGGPSLAPFRQQAASLAGLAPVACRSRVAGRLCLHTRRTASVRHTLYMPFLLQRASTRT